MEKIRNINILPGCISCGTCQAICPEVFYVEQVCKVRKEVDLQRHKDCIKAAAEACPVKVIELI